MYWMGSEKKVMRYFAWCQCDPHHCCVMPCLINLFGVVGFGGFHYYFGLCGRAGSYQCMPTDTCSTTWLIPHMFNSWQKYFLTYSKYYRNLQADHHYHPLWSFKFVSNKLLFRIWILLCSPSVWWKEITMMCVCVSFCSLSFPPSVWQQVDHYVQMLVWTYDSRLYWDTILSDFLL
jgi:hypothetical protein